MVNLNNYITEKLKIDKNIKIPNKIDYELVGNILTMCGWNFGEYKVESFIKKKIEGGEPLVKGIVKWTIDEKVSNFIGYAYYAELKEWEEEKKIINMFIDDNEIVEEYDNKFCIDEEFLEKIDGDDMSTQYEIYYDNKALLYKESDNGENWCKRLFIKEN